MISSDKMIVFMNETLRSEIGNHVGERCYRSPLAVPGMCEACPLDSGWPFDEMPYKKVYHQEDGRAFEYMIVKYTDPKTLDVYYVCMEREITNILAAEAKLDTLASCFDQMADPVIVVDLGGRAMYVNKAFMEVTGCKDKASAGATMEAVTSIAKNSCTLQSIMKQAITQNVLAEVAGLRKSGLKYYANVEAKPVRDEDGQVLGAVGILRDVTRERAERAELEKYRAQLEERMLERTNELAKRVGQLTTINKISRDVTSILDPDELLDEFLRSIQQGFGFAQVALMMMDPDRDELFLKAGCSRAPSTLPSDLRLRLREGIIGHAAYYCETLVSGNVREDSRYLELNQTSTKSELAIPVVFRGELLGVLDLQNDSPESFSTNDVSVLEMLADMLAIALTNARTFTESKERENALSVLDRLSKQISSRLDANVILEQIARDAASLLQAEKAAVGLIDNKTNLVRWVSSCGFDKGALARLVFTADTGITGRAMRRLKPEVANEYLSDPDAREDYAEMFDVKSLVVAPLLLEGRGIGMINVYNKMDGRSFTPTDVTFLSSLADHAAIALENAKLLSSLNQRVSSQLALLTTSLSLQKEIDSGSIYEFVAEKLREVVWYDSLSVYMIEHPESMMVPVFANGVYAEEVMAETFPVGEGIIGAIAVNGVAEIIDDNALDSRAVLVAGTDDEKEAMMVVPLMGREKVIGVISMYRLGGATFAPSEFEVVQLFANQAAVAVENAELYRTQNELLAESTRKVEQMAKVLELTTSVMYMDDINKLLTRLVNLVVQSFGFKRASVSLYDAEMEVFVNRALAGYPPWVQLGEVFSLENVLQDMKEENRIGHNSYLSKFEKQDYGIDAFSFLAHPERADKPRSSPDSWHERDILLFSLKDRGGHLSGYILVDEPLDGKLPSKSQIEAMEILAGITSIAVENSKAFEHQVLSVNEIALLNDLMTHDINNFNQGIMGYVELLLEDRRLDETQRKYAEKALHQVRNNARLIDNVRKLSKVRMMSESDYSRVDLYEPISQAIDAVMKVFTDRRVIVNSSVVSEKYYISGNKYAYDVFYNVISNAVKFDSASTVRVDVTLTDESSPKGDFWIVSVSDRGRGIPDDRKEVVFERFASGMTGTKGFGLGLSIVSSIVGKFGGRIWVEDRVKGDHSKGAVFRIRLPKYMDESAEKTARNNNRFSS